MISIRAPLAGSDATASATVPPSALFQSALPLRGATQAVAGSGVPDKISIRAPLAGSDNCEFYNITGNPDFNPRSPYGERPVLSSSNISISGIFQSALPLRGATPYGHTIIQHATISIRAPLAGSDQTSGRYKREIFHFNPRSPCGERPCRCTASILCRYFNPRSPCGERHKAARCQQQQ